MVFFILPLAEVSPKVLFVKKVVERWELDTRLGSWNPPHTARCVQTGGEGVGEVRDHLPPKTGFRHGFGLRAEFIRVWIPSFRLEPHLLLTEAAHKLSLHISAYQQQPRL